MDTFDKVTKAAEKLEIFSNSILEDRKALTPLAILWAGYTIAEAIKDAAPRRKPRPVVTIPLRLPEQDTQAGTSQA